MRGWPRDGGSRVHLSNSACAARQEWCFCFGAGALGRRASRSPRVDSRPLGSFAERTPFTRLRAPFSKSRCLCKQNIMSQANRVTKQHAVAPSFLNVQPAAVDGGYPVQTQAVGALGLRVPRRQRKPKAHDARPVHLHMRLHEPALVRQKEA